VSIIKKDYILGRTTAQVNTMGNIISGVGIKPPRAGEAPVLNFGQFILFATLKRAAR
jgi:hypothetical protein